ncbi:MAG: 50S ribosomal protein L20, partial [Candidatus Omnitrophota bacterium]|nr:50S ribosomal protein L20 [Candidatus Omnitrophota bacterium]
MARVKHAASSKRRKKRVLKQAKGQYAQRSKRHAQALRSLRKGLTYQYRDRKVKKRDMRSLWIVRIHAACREEGL